MDRSILCACGMWRKMIVERSIGQKGWSERLMTVHAYLGVACRYTFRGRVMTDKIIHLIRHAEGEHNVDKRWHSTWPIARVSP